METNFLDQEYAKMDEIQNSTNYSSYTAQRFCCGGDYCDGDHNGFIKSFLRSSLLRLLDEVEKVEGMKLTLKNKQYDGNNLESAADFYGIAPENWSEVIRLEEGYNRALSDVIKYVTSLRNQLGEKK